MEIQGKVAVITGGGGGIGSAIAAAMVERGARVVVADLDGDAADAAANTINATYPAAASVWHGDASDAGQIESLLAHATAAFGPVDVYFANAGVVGPPGLEAGEVEWDRVFNINVRAHIRAARVLVPRWLERGAGYFIATASAAGLLTQIGGVAYSVTKHAAVAFAEWLRIAYGDAGVRVSCLCPMGVNTRMLNGSAPGELAAVARRAVTAAGAVLEPTAVATVVMEAIADERFLILPHPEVLEMFRHKASDYDRWLRGMQRYRKSLESAVAGDRA